MFIGELHLTTKKNKNKQMKKLWEGSNQFKQKSHLSHYKTWLNDNYNLTFEDYDALWLWSINHIEDFWKSICDYFNVNFHSPYQKVISSYTMPGAKWFEGATLNYTEHIFKNYKADKTAIIFGHDSGTITNISWKELKTKVASMASYLKSLGVTKGDRVVAFLPNIPEATISFLAVNSIGAIWSSTSPDFGTDSVIDRFFQINPKVLIAVDGYYYNNKSFDKTNTVKDIVSALPSLEKVIIHPYLNENDLSNFPDNFININSIWQENPPELTSEYVEFNDPIWILYSSGTTGLPNPL